MVQMTSQVLDQLKDEINHEAGVKTVRMEILRDAAGYQKLGKWVVDEIGKELQRRAIGYAPDPLPTDAYQTVLLFDLGSDVGKVVHAVQHPGTDGAATTLRSFANRRASDALARIRAVIEEMD